MWLVGLHFVWWALLASIFCAGRALGGLAGHSLCLIASLAPFTYTPSFESLFGFYVLWIATPLKNLKNRPTYINTGIILDGNTMRFDSPAKGKTGYSYSHLFFRATEVIQDDERMITARLGDKATEKRLVVNPTQTILPPSLSEMTFQATDGTTVLSLTEFVQPLLRGGQGTIKHAILLALLKQCGKDTMFDFPIEWTVGITQGDDIRWLKVNFRQELDPTLEQLIN